MADEYQPNLSLKIPFGDPKNSTTFQDFSNLSKAVTNIGNVITSENASKWYSTSAEFNGVDKALEFNHENAWNFLKQDFTIEGWVKVLESESNCIVSTSRNYLKVHHGGVGPGFAGNGGWGFSKYPLANNQKAQNGNLGQGGNGASSIGIGGGGGGGGGGYFGGGGGGNSSLTNLCLNLDLTYLGPLVSIDEAPSLISDINSLPTSGFLKFILKKDPEDILIDAYYKRNGSSFSLSSFTTNNLDLTYTSNIQSILNYSNDDHDTLFMDADGGGIISRTNTNSWTGNFDKFKGNSVLLSDRSISHILKYPPLGEGTYQTFIAFPKTQSGIWIRFDNKQYSINGSPASSLPADLANLFSNSSPENSIWHISDGINQFMVGRFGLNTAYIVTLNLKTKLIENVTTKTLSSSPTMYNGTEQDAEGVQLFVVNGSSSFQKGTYFYYNGPGWKDDPDPFSTTGRTQFQAGVLDTQTGMDIITTIDDSGYIWFADWGHGDGGLFNVGNDNFLNMRRTNIFLVPEISLFFDNTSGGGGGGGGSNYIDSSFILTLSKRGDEEFNSPSGIPEKGHAGDGYCRITKISDNTSVNFVFTGDVQTYTIPENGLYEIKLWGAQGGGTSVNGVREGGRGGFVKGTKEFNAGEILYIFVGGQNGYNGGGLGGTSELGEPGSNGGGATDIRTIQDDLGSRILVAGGGGGNGGANYGTTKPTSGLGGAAERNGSSSFQGGLDDGLVIFFDYQAKCFWAFIKFTDGTSILLKDFYQEADITQFNHFMLTRSGSIFRLFRNGILTDQVDINNNEKILSGSNSPYLYLGCIKEPNGIKYPLRGYLNDIRILKGVARRTTNFTPPGSFYTTYSVSGKITDENGLPVRRKVRLYNLESGNLMDEKFSEQDTGIYTLTSGASGQHYVVALDDDTGQLFNHLIIRVNPTEI